MWNIFYGNNNYGPMVIKYTIIVTILDCLYMVVNSLMQSINKRNIIYVSVITGLILNLILDIPFMYIFSKLGLPAYYGAITATLVGFIISNTISLIFLNKEMHIDYKETLLVIPRFILSTILLIVILTLFKKVLPINNPNRLIQVANILISGIISGGIYLIVNIKSIKTILPPRILKMLKLSN